MQRDLEAVLRRSYGDVQTPIMRQHLDFALSTRERGRALLDKVESQLGTSIDGKRVLDVGCAYAGFVIEAAARGASAWGVEISRKLWEYGKINAKGESGDIQLVPGDFVSRRVLEVLPDDFDLVLVNDVFEHVYNTAGLLGQLSRVMSDGASFTFSIPNGHAVRHVEREGHYGKAGLTLVPPNWWPSIVPSFTAFYRPWSFYTGLFRSFGFNEISVWNGEISISLDEARAQIKAGLERAETAVNDIEYRDAKGRAAVEASFKDYQAELHRDLERGDLEQLSWKYMTGFWKGTATKSGPVLAEIDLASPATAPSTSFARVQLARRPEELRTPWTKRAESTIEPRAGTVRCEVSGSDDVTAGQYGGIRLPIDSPTEIMLDIEFLDPENVEAVYIDGEDSRRCRVLRWEWQVKGEGPRPSTRRETFTLSPGAASGPFEPTGTTFPMLVTDLHIFVRVSPRKRAGFVVHQLEVR